MPFRTRETIQPWLDEFRQLGFAVSDTLRVAELEGEDGVVILNLEHSPTNVFLHPNVQDGQARWVVTFEARDEAVEMDGAGLARLNAELGALSALVAFLQAKSAAFLQR